MKNYDYLIIGGGIVGLTIAYELRSKYPKKSIAIIEKEKSLAMHASGRNSGVLHAGFYYTSDTLKAKLTVEGNKMMKSFCAQNNIKVNECGKVVIAQNEEELKTLYELEKRGKVNKVNVRIIDEIELNKIEPNAKTYKKALYSPNTASVNPTKVCLKLAEILESRDVNIFLNTKYIKRNQNKVITNDISFNCKMIINSAGLYADKIAKDFGFAKGMTIIPFKGLYVKSTNSQKEIKTNIYPVPNLLNPFLGVHYTVTSDNIIKIGPTSTPAFWRENYEGLNNFNIFEFLQIIYYESKLFLLNSFNFRKLAIEEIKKYNRNYFVGLATNMTKKVDDKSFDTWVRPGIRAQLLDTNTNELIMDFKIQGDDKSIHILNAISPAFTCSFAFSKYIINKMNL